MEFFPFLYEKLPIIHVIARTVVREVVCRLVHGNQTKALCHKETMQMLLIGQHQPARFIMALERV